MNIDEFKSQFIAAMAQSGLQWVEEEGYEGPGSMLTTEFVMPRYHDGCSLRMVASEDMVTLTFILDRIVPSFDNLKLMNDFNANVDCLNASIIRMGREGQPFLVLKANLFNVESEAGAIAFVGKVLNYVLSDAVAPYLRPLTIITE